MGFFEGGEDGLLDVLLYHAIGDAYIARTEFYASVRDVFEGYFEYTTSLRQIWPVELTLACARFKEAVPQLVKMAEWRDRVIGWKLDGFSR